MTDKRVRKTQQALRSALLELIVERGYEKVSVQDILDRAEVGRATFYMHYRSKEDLLRRSLDQLRELLVQECGSAAGSQRKPTAPIAFSSAFFRHVDSHRKLYRAVVGRESGLIIDRQMRRVLTDLVRDDLALSRHPPRSQSASDMVSQYVVGALMSMVTWWLDYSIKLSPLEIDKTFRQMTVPAIASQLK
jgi:AcrR family transcriptional regulator